jgi:pimeloyl-ACP methyl ester carboxylesterase
MDWGRLKRVARVRTRAAVGIFRRKIRPRRKIQFVTLIFCMITTTTQKRLRFLLCSFMVLCFGAVLVQTIPRQGFAQSTPWTASGATPTVIVIGFVGGFIKHDNPVHSEVQLAERLRKAYPSGVAVETFESYRGKEARKKVLKLLDANHDGVLTSEEKANSRIIIYGHSWGGSQALDLARKLGEDGIPVSLTIQVDSISKLHQNDEVIPANVAQAANFYQPNGLLHGRAKIRAADPARTKIVGNFRFDYQSTPYKCDKYPWYDRLFVKPHTQIECDPSVWKQAGDLIESNLRVVEGGSPVAR